MIYVSSIEGSGRCSNRLFDKSIEVVELCLDQMSSFYFLSSFGMQRGTFKGLSLVLIVADGLHCWIFCLWILTNRIQNEIQNKIGRSTISQTCSCNSHLLLLLCFINRRRRNVFNQEKPENKKMLNHYVCDECDGWSNRKKGCLKEV